MRLLVLLFIVSATGCSAPPKPSTAARQEAALEANRKGEAYVRHGELESAARSYREALRFSQALEDAEGIAANAINLSIVRQRQGRFAEARASLAAVLDQRNLKFSNARLAEVSLRQALLDLDEKNLAGADDWMAKATAHCAERCPAGAAIHNVRAQLALQAGRTDAAFLAARSAHDASLASGDQVEQANALRLLGIVGLKNGEAASARQHLEQALAIDRELGAPRKIALDLLALGQAAALGGDRESARAYYARALAVGEADRDVAVTAEARALLAH
ncbi:MAG TPA: tetratricopeptide repeat protein [Burkholderiales bacterium]